MPASSWRQWTPTCSRWFQQPRAGNAAWRCRRRWRRSRRSADAKNLLLIPERHTRNMFYLQNVARLSLIMRRAGLNVRLGSLSEEITEPTPIELPDGQTWWWSRWRAWAGPPAGAEGLRSVFDPAQQRPVRRHSADPGEHQRAVPAAAAACRLVDAAKTSHFAAYDEVAKKFAADRCRPVDGESLRALLRHQFPRARRRGRTGRHRRGRAEEDRQEVSRVRHQGRRPTWWSRPMPAPMAWAS